MLIVRRCTLESGQIVQAVCVCVCVCTGWRSIAGQIKETAPKCQATYCLIHRELLAVNNLPSHPDSVLKEMIQISNMV